MQNIRALDYCQGKCPPTRRALEAGDSAAFLSIIPASSFLCSQAESTFRPQVTPTVGLHISTMLQGRYM